MHDSRCESDHEEDDSKYDEQESPQARQRSDIGEPNGRVKSRVSAIRVFLDELASIGGFRYRAGIQTQLGHDGSSCGSWYGVDGELISRLPSSALSKTPNRIINGWRRAWLTVGKIENESVNVGYGIEKS